MNENNLTYEIVKDSPNTDQTTTPFVIDTHTGRHADAVEYAGAYAQDHAARLSVPVQSVAVPGYAGVAWYFTTNNGTLVRYWAREARSADSDLTTLRQSVTL